MALLRVCLERCRCSGSVPVSARRIPYELNRRVVLLYHRHGELLLSHCCDVASPAFTAFIVEILCMIRIDD